LLFLFFSLLLLNPFAFAQTSSAALSGTVMDPSGAVVPDVEIIVTNADTNVSVVTKTNGSGIYVVEGLKPGRYRIVVTKKGFKQIAVTDFTLNVQDTVSRNFTLELGATSETVNVSAGGELNVNTTDASVSTVIDRQFAENLPMNGRSFQALVYLTPGVSLNVGSSGQSGYATGQFTVNGQRAASNYWMVDGVSGNIGITPWLTPGGGSSGSLGSFNTMGGTSSLVSIDALQEFRIQTSTYAPEFGRTPGGQISIATRSGTNQFHGTVFDYFRNSVLDATDWFADANRLPKAEERQNDFGGTIGGPIFKDKTFFFFSYEGLRLRQPQTGLTTVPDLAARQNAIPALQPFLRAFPLPNGPELLDTNGNPTGVAQFNASFSNPSSLNAYSIRIDHALTKNLNLFGRYNYSPSNLLQRGYNDSLNTIYTVTNSVKTATIGATWTKSAAMVNDLRFNYSASGGSTAASMDTFGGGTIAPGASQLPNPFTPQDSVFYFDIYGGTNMGFYQGKNAVNEQHQYNLVDTVSVQRGSHSLKFGVDYRRLSPLFSPDKYGQAAFFMNVPSAEAGNLLVASILSEAGATFLFHNLGLFAQDTWRLTPRLTMTYGLRWDMDFAPSTKNGPSFVALTGFNMNDLSQLALAPAGTPPYKTRYGNVAPRLGIAYQLSQNPDWGLVLRGGFGVFYDLASSEVGNNIAYYPFRASKASFGGSFPMSASVAAPPPMTAPGNGSGTLSGFDPNLNLPYTLQWNVALEQALGRAQKLTASYIGSVGRRLLAAEYITTPNPNYGNANLVGNGGTSSYNSLQVQFQRRLSAGLQTLVSYTWSHSIDEGSYGLYRSGSIANLNANKGDSDFDIRQTLAAALTYDLPAPKINAFTNAILQGWSMENIIQVHSAPPGDAVIQSFFQLSGQNSALLVRPDLVPGQPLYLYGSQYPGGKALNPSAFTNPPVDPNTRNPMRQGNLGRNALRAFGYTQWDFAIHRDFPIHESVKLQFRAEMFNVLNHPNFAPPNLYLGIGDPNFGRSTQMLGQYMAAGAAGNGGFNSLYQGGGPRSIQLALKLFF
jgi:hypothetical protein